MHLTRNFILATIFAVTLFANSSQALPSDKDKKATITADASTYNYKTGVNLFEGNVQIEQGTTHLQADRLITKNGSNHKIHEAIAYGLSKPAHYWTAPRAGEQPMHAQANIIKYYPEQATVTLEGNVLVTQGENSFHGEIIVYNMKDQLITVPPSKVGRAVLVYNPDK